MSSIFDVIKTVVLDPELNFASIKEILKGIDELPINHPFYTQMYEYTDEELTYLVGEIVVICGETDQYELIPLINQLFIHILPSMDSARYYPMLLANKFVPESMIVEITRADPSISVPELLLQTIQGDRSYQHLYERIRPLITQMFVSGDVMTSLLQMAADRGNQEAYGFLRAAYNNATRFQISLEPNISRFDYMELLQDECRDMDLYFRKLVTWRNTSVRETVSSKNRIERETYYRLIERVCGVETLEENVLENLTSKTFFGIRHIRYFELLNWLENNTVFRRLYGPQQRARILEYSETLELPEDPREDYMLFNQESWYTGLCDHCHMQVRPYQMCFRKPEIEGGWDGCYCSPTCVMRHILYIKYNIQRENIDGKLDVIRRQLGAFFKDIGLDFETGIGMLVRDYPIIQTDDKGEVKEGTKFRLPRIIITEASEEMVPLTQPLSNHDSLMDAGKEILEKLGMTADDFGLLEDDGETIKYTEELLLQGDDIETYALVHFQTNEWQRISPAISNIY